MLGVVAHSCNPSTQNEETIGLWVPSQPEQCNELETSLE